MMSLKQHNGTPGLLVFPFSCCVAIAAWIFIEIDSRSILDKMCLDFGLPEVKAAMSIDPSQRLTNISNNEFHNPGTKELRNIAPIQHPDTWADCRAGWAP